MEAFADRMALYWPNKLSCLPACNFDSLRVRTHSAHPFRRWHFLLYEGANEDELNGVVGRLVSTQLGTAVQREERLVG